MHRKWHEWKTVFKKAMFELGRLFRDKLEHYTKSTEFLEELLTSYDPPFKKIESYYYLYLDYLDLNDQTNATKYYNLILEEAPDSEFAKVLKDPNYLNSKNDKSLEIYKYYEETFALYENGKIDEACERVNKVNDLFEENPLKAKFAMLKAFCTGKFEGKDAYIQSLKDVVANYPKTPEQTHARELLRILMGGDPVAQKSSIIKYTIERDRLHYIIVILIQNGWRYFK